MSKKTIVDNPLFIPLVISLIIPAVYILILNDDVSVSESFEASAQSRTLADVDRDLANVERDFATAESDITLLRSDLGSNVTRIKANEDAQRDFNPVIEPYDVTVLIPPTVRNSDQGTQVFVTCGGEGSNGDLEIPIGFSYETAPRKVDRLFIKQFAIGLDSPSLNELVVEFYNYDTEPVQVEIFLMCATIDVIP